MPSPVEPSENRASYRPWNDEEKKRLKELTISPARCDRTRLKALYSHFQAGLPIFPVTHYGDPVHASADFARKIKRLTESGELDWLFEPVRPHAPELRLTDKQGSADAKSAAESIRVPRDTQHLAELSTLADRLRHQLSVPLPHLRVGGDRVSWQEFFQSLVEGPGNYWYWGWETTQPMLAVERDPSFPLLLQHLESLALRRNLDAIRSGVDEYVNMRKSMLEPIKRDSVRTTGMPLDDTGRVNGGTITMGFPATVYETAVVQASRRQRMDHRHKYTDGSRSVAGSRIPSLPRNSALFFEDKLIAWVERRFVLGRGRDTRVERNHQDLIDRWTENTEIRAIVSKYLALGNEARELQERLAPSVVSKALVSGI